MSESETHNGGQQISPHGEGGILLKTPQEIAQEQANQEKERENNRRELQLGFNGIVAITSAFTVAVLIYQAHVMNRTLKEVAKQSAAAKTSAEVAGRAADSAKQAADVAGQSLEVGERAYITIDSDTSPTFVQFGPDKQVILKVLYINTGHTPATHLAMGVQEVIISEDDPEHHVLNLVVDPKQYSMEIGRGGISEATIPPGRTGFGNAVGNIVSADQYRKIIGGTMFLGVHGQILYKDVFGKDRSTEFCFIFLNGGAFAFCHKYNRIN